MTLVYLFLSEAGWDDEKEPGNQVSTKSSIGQYYLENGLWQKNVITLVIENYLVVTIQGRFMQS